VLYLRCCVYLVKVEFFSNTSTEKISTETIYICYLRQIDRDCELLEQEGIMDYSLLVGIHFKDISENGEIISSESHTPAGTTAPKLLIDIPTQHYSKT